MKKVAIIGGGISGLYLANLLQNNPNYDYTIFEKRFEHDLSDGYGIQLSVNSVKLLNEVGFRNISAYELSFPKKVNFFDARTNNKICDIDIFKFNYDNTKYTTLKRSSLVQFLLKNIPAEKIKNNIELKSIVYTEKLKLNLSNNIKEEFDYLIVSDGIFSKTSSIVLQKDISPKYFNSVALRGNIINYNNDDISLYLGSNFHFVIYPVNQNKEFNFISIINKNLTKDQLQDKNLFKNNDFLQSLTKEIFHKTSLELEGKIENLKSFPIYISKKFNISNRKNIYFVGDALFACPPSFAQGASQSIESSKELYEEINNNINNYYEKRLKRLNSVNWRSKLNYFVFHLSNPITIFFRNIILKLLVKNNKFLESYLGRIYRD